MCLEDQGLALNDGTNKVFLSTKGTAEDISRPLKNFLDYVDGKAPADELMHEIDNEVLTARDCEDWRREYMTLALEIKMRERAAMAEGEAKGRIEGMLQMALSLFRKGKLTEQEAAEEAGMSVEAFQKAVATL